jgi:hypothetical protein
MIKYADALKKYNEGSDKWCIPRKGSKDYLKIREMMNIISHISKASQKSKASHISKASQKSEASQKSKTSNIKMKDKLELFNVSGKNNNCFFNSIYLILNETKDFKFKSGSYLRKYLYHIFLKKENLKKTIKKFMTYLELAQFYINDGIPVEEISQLLSVNVREIKSLKKAKIRKIDLNNKDEIKALLEKHFTISGRMPSQPEMSLAIDYIKNNYNIVVLSIILNSGNGNSTDDKTLDVMNRYYRNKNDLVLRENMKTEIISKVRRRIGEKLENVIKATGSSGLPQSANKYNYGVIITNNTHYQLLKINNNIINSITDLNNFIESQDNSFSFSKTDVRSRSSS